MTIRSLIFVAPFLFLAMPAIAETDPACIEVCEDAESRAMSSCRTMLTQNESEKASCEGSASLERMSCESNCPDLEAAPEAEAPSE